MIDAIELKWFRYEDLSKEILYNLLRFRQEIFIVEQQSPYLDSDGLDQQAFHLIAFKGKELVACARLGKIEGDKSPYIKFGRLAIQKPYRGSGLGEKLLEQLFAFSEQHFPGLDQKADAQSALIDYYKKFGFKAIGDPFDDGGVMHQTIVRKGRS
jgi:ElaA protein